MGRYLYLTNFYSIFCLICCDLFFCCFFFGEVGVTIIIMTTVNVFIDGMLNKRRNSGVITTNKYLYSNNLKIFEKSSMWNVWATNRFDAILHEHSNVETPLDVKYLQDRCVGFVSTGHWPFKSWYSHEDRDNPFFPQKNKLRVDLCFSHSYLKCNYMDPHLSLHTKMLKTFF